MSLFNSRINYLNYPHVLMLTETWFNDCSVSKIANYTLFKKNRNIVRGGGIAIYVRSDINAFEVNDDCLSTDAELVWCNIICSNESILCGCVYRPPQASYETNCEITKAIGRAKHLIDSKKYSSVIIAGDFNHSDIEWFDYGGICQNKGRPSSLNMLDCLNSNSLNQLVLRPTFESKVLDLVIVDDPSRCFQIEHGPPLGCTNKNRLHCTLTWEFYLKTSNIDSIANRKKLAISKGNFELFSTVFANSMLNVSYNNVNDAYISLIEAYEKASNLSIPLKMVKRHKFLENPKWFNKDVKSATNKKYKLHCQLRSSPSNEDIRVEYRIICKRVKALVKQSIIKFESDLVSRCKENPKLLYSYINEQRSCRNTIRSLIDKNGVSTSSEIDIVNILNEQFSEVFNPQAVCTIELDQMTISQVQVVETDTFSAMNVIKYIDRLNAHKSAGADKIHPQVIKKCRQVFATILSPIFQESFKCGVVPVSWKEANITPIFKKGQRPSPANYRPVSLTAVPCKIMERILHDVMLKHLMANNLVAPEQHGFVLSSHALRTSSKLLILLAILLIKVTL